MGSPTRWQAMFRRRFSPPDRPRKLRPEDRLPPTCTRRPRGRVAQGQGPGSAARLAWSPAAGAASKCWRGGRSRAGSAWRHVCCSGVRGAARQPLPAAHWAPPHHGVRPVAQAHELQRLQRLVIGCLKPARLLALRCRCGRRLLTVTSQESCMEADQLMRGHDGRELVLLRVAEQGQGWQAFRGASSHCHAAGCTAPSQVDRMSSAPHSLAKYRRQPPEAAIQLQHTPPRWRRSGT